VESLKMEMAKAEAPKGDAKVDDKGEAKPAESKVEAPVVIPPLGSAPEPVLKPGPATK